ncbi:sulfotransferase [Phenylobacterium sp.]|uniref:tetratricopeptide repeat-containing sulfotransferase family protein n=1 Tax=Phenylobacterium sp. TaxID=1871053 RepID=UPI002CA297D6|nr:sulfotransferase [Phenylobacterium sp.]HVI33616.1 sulfotransferase [Phenylobacterium sp.]
MTHTDAAKALQEAQAAARLDSYASARHADVIRRLHSIGCRQQALDELRRVAGLRPGSAADAEALGFTAFGLGEHALAHQFYAVVVDQAPSDATAWYNVATTLRNIGRLGESEAACTRCLGLDSSYAQAALLRSHLKTQSTEANHLDELRALLGRARHDLSAQIFLNYALGKELDDIGAFDDAFRHFADGAALRRRSLAYDVELDVRKLERIKAVYDPARLSSARPRSPVPYGFIIGLPRSGTTLIERVLTGHPSVRSNGETDNFLQALMSALAPNGADVFERAARADHAQVGAAYAALAGPPTVGDGLVLEKLPLNYLYVGAIRLALPGARIVRVQRRPADNLFAMFSTLFGDGYPFSYDLRELARYYAAYKALDAYWLAHAGDLVAPVSYEAFTADPAGLGAALADHVGIDWRTDMVKVEKNTTATATASAAQVRQPIYRKSDGRWRNYAKHLAPLIEDLKAAGIDPDET